LCLVASRTLSFQRAGLCYPSRPRQPAGDAGDQYIGLDRFGRVVDQRWLNSSTGAVSDEFTYGYDQDSNVLYQGNQVNSAFGELYHASGASNGYDGLGQLTNFARGTLSISSGNTVPDTIASPTASESWSLDALGNWTSFTTGSTTQTRTANQQNEITSVSGATTPGYDANGNTTTDQTGKTLIYDAWNRLVEVKSGSTVLEQYSYDSLGRRITETPSGSPTKSLYYSSSWQVLEEDWSGAMQVQYVWSAVYVDAMVERDRGSERLYVLEDGNWNVTALVSTSGVVQERYVYDPYGQATILDPNWNVRSNSSFAWVYLHQGGRYDTATGLYSFRNRDYSPVLGRWTELDPLTYQGGTANFYEYNGDQPPTAIDPTGLDFIALADRLVNAPIYVGYHYSLEYWETDAHGWKPGLGEIWRVGGAEGRAHKTESMELLNTAVTVEVMKNSLLPWRGKIWTTETRAVSVIRYGPPNFDTATRLESVFESKCEGGKEDNAPVKDKWDRMKQFARSFSYAEQDGFGGNFQNWPDSQYHIGSNVVNSNTFARAALGSAGISFVELPGSHPGYFRLLDVTSGRAS
jgi:RHS repeat-associated protein